MPRKKTFPHICMYYAYYAIYVVFTLAPAGFIYDKPSPLKLLKMSKALAKL